MGNGWICLHRDMLDWEWIDDHNATRLFTFLLLMANHKDKKYRGTIIPKGSLMTGRILLSQKTGMSERQIRTALDKLKSTSEVTIKSTSKYSIISITNWDKYQDKDQQPVQQEASERPTDDQRATTNNNETIKQDNKETKSKRVTQEKIITPYQEIVDCYHSVLPELSRVAKISVKRKSCMNKLFKEDLPTIKSWHVFFSQVQESDFLMGRSKDWQCDFEWLINSNNALKVVEGKYKNNGVDLSKMSKVSHDNYSNIKDWVPPSMRKQ